MSCFKRYRRQPRRLARVYSSKPLSNGGATMKTVIAFLALLVLSSAAFGDDPQMYKWTDVDGVVHYSDKPPVEAVTDLQTLDIPSFPAQDPAKIAAEQAELVAQIQAVQQLLQTQAAQQAQAAALA